MFSVRSKDQERLGALRDEGALAQPFPQEDLPHKDSGSLGPGLPLQPMLCL